MTSLNDSEAFNMGAAGTIEHDRRYDRADELMKNVIDVECVGAGRYSTRQSEWCFADPAKSIGPNTLATGSKTRAFTVPQSPQGHPVVIQAGQSGRGRQFAIEWGEVIFTILTSVEQGKQVRSEMRADAERLGRDPDTITIAPAVYVTVGETQSIAEDKYAYIDSLAKPIDGLALLSEALNYDFATKQMDEPFSDEELEGISGLRGILDRII